MLDPRSNPNRPPRSRRLIRRYPAALRALTWLACAGLSSFALGATGIAGSPESADVAPWVVRPETPPVNLGRTAVPAPLHWEPGPTERFVGRPRLIWRVTPETAVTGWAGDSLEPRAIRQTRLRLALERTDGEPELLGWIQHVANTEVALLAPGDPRAADPGPALADSLYPWPNACVAGVYDLDRSLDLNLNDRMELPIRFFAAVSDPAASGVLLVEPDSVGHPRVVHPSEYIGTIRGDEVILTSIRFTPGKRDPVLEAQWPELEHCRFLTRLGVRGWTDCVACCRVPIHLRRDTQGVFHPGYDRATHHALLDRLKEDLSLLSSEGDGALTSEEQAALARAAAFFYLTGTGTKTRQEIQKALGARADLAPVRLLLKRLDAYFLYGG